MPNEEEVLASASPNLCRNPRLQIAHDFVMLLPASESFDDSGEPTEKYRKLWTDYIIAGGSRTMLEPDIDNENWLRFF